MSFSFSIGYQQRFNVPDTLQQLFTPESGQVKIQMQQLSAQNSVPPTAFMPFDGMDVCVLFLHFILLFFYCSPTIYCGRFCNNSDLETLISKRFSVENKAKLSQLETQNTSSAVLFIYNFQLREFRFVLYR